MRLQTDFVDLYYQHRIDPNFEPEVIKTLPTKKIPAVNQIVNAFFCKRRRIKKYAGLECSAWRFNSHDHFAKKIADKIAIFISRFKIGKLNFAVRARENYCLLHYPQQKADLC